jgi:murein L,D-transpeptidase YcbB/YkuD
VRDELLARIKQEDDVRPFKDRSAARVPAGVALAVVCIGVMLPGLASASPLAGTIYPGECPPAPGSWPVHCVQAALSRDAGKPQLQIDGCYGPETQQAVMDLQRFFGLTPDGIIGPKTGDALDTIVVLNDDPQQVNGWKANCYPVIPTLD